MKNQDRQFSFTQFHFDVLLCLDDYNWTKTCILAVIISKGVKNGNNMFVDNK
jgi:hypothetical protein